MVAFVFCCARSFRASAHITCFHSFCSNSVNFYRTKIIFNVFWEPMKNPTSWSYLFASAMARYAEAGEFTYARLYFVCCRYCILSVRHQCDKYKQPRLIVATNICWACIGVSLAIIDQEYLNQHMSKLIYKFSIYVLHVISF